MTGPDKFLHEALYEAVSAVINSLSFSPTPDPIREGVVPSGLEPGQSQTILNATTQHIVDTLLREAYANGLPGEPRLESQYRRPSTGSTAEEVLTITSRVSCVFKCDSNRKLAEEVRMLRELKRRADLPESFRARFPFIYAARIDDPPYAYLMEYFDEHIGLEEILFGNPVADDDIFRTVTSILDCLFEAYKRSTHRLHKPNLDEIYFKRIRDTLGSLRNVDGEFDRIMQSSEVVVNGTLCEQYELYLKRLSSKVSEYEPGFTTFVHGDPNPENILVKISTHAVDVKFIDVKEWGDGDYLFDIAKLVHYILITGPVERLHNPIQAQLLFPSERTVELNYSLGRPAVLDAVAKMIEKRTEQFAAELGDIHWRQRFALAMAANLLGLPLGRIKREKRESALILYSEGLKWLREVCTSM